MAIDISVEERGDALTIAVAGSLNTNTATELEDVVETTLAGRTAPMVVFDLTHLEYISSAGLRVLMVAYRRAESQGGVMEVQGASDDVQETLDITGFSELFLRTDR